MVFLFRGKKIFEGSGAEARKALKACKEVGKLWVSPDGKEVRLKSPKQVEKIKEVTVN